ncbi:MAG TPA: hypothetical protein VGN69_01830 [Solirubrobacteraceae bacterium]|nr:hypothetical protein [Solirubrobacteraceae bacterium]
MIGALVGAVLLAWSSMADAHGGRGHPSAACGQLHVHGHTYSVETRGPTSYHPSRSGAPSCVVGRSVVRHYLRSRRSTQGYTCQHYGPDVTCRKGSVKVFGTQIKKA